MRRLLTAALLAVAQATHAQEIPEFNKLRTPDSPAFTILGISPTQVQRPTTPSTFSASFLQDFVQQGGLLPESFALETTPFWWFSHPQLDLDDYSEPGAKSVYRNLSFSIATTTETGSAMNQMNDMEGMEGLEDENRARKLALGFRTTLAPGRSVANTCIGELQELSVAISRIFFHRTAEVRRDAAVRADNALFAAKLVEIEQEVAEQREALKEKTAECVKNVSAREGFVLDVASALALRFPEGRANDGDVTTVGAWLTPAYLKGSFSGVGVVRVSWDGLAGDTSTTNVDLGLSTVYSRDRYAVSLEGVWRNVDRADENSDHFRVSLGFDVKLFGGTWLTTAFGKDFEGDNADSLIALANLKWGTGSRAIKAPEISFP